MTTFAALVMQLWGILLGQYVTVPFTKTVGGSTFNLIQSSSSIGGTGNISSISITVSATASGSHIGVFADSFNAYTWAATPVTDNQGNTYSYVQNASAGCPFGGNSCVYAYCVNCTAGVTTITVSLSTAGTFRALVGMAWEVSGVSSYDSASATTLGGGQSSPWTSSSFTPTASKNEWMEGVYYTSSGTSTTAGTGGWSLGSNLNDTTDGQSIGFIYQVVASTTGSYAATGTTSTGNTSVGAGTFYH
jgi:hypothetical protein